MDTPINVCTYCGKGFSKARTLQVHLCEPKRRHLQKDEKWVINGFMVFQRFYQIHQNATKPKSYEDFCKSPYYNAFVKFGRYMMHVHPLYPEKYIDYIIMSKVKLDHWARDDLYETYLIDTLKLEPLEAALQRAIQTMMEWAEEQNAQWSDYFRLVSTPRAVHDITRGKITPWLVLGCDPGKKMLNSFTDEQLEIVERFLEPEFWTSKFKQYPADHMFVQETVRGAKIE